MREDAQRCFERHSMSVLGRSVVTGLLVVGIVGIGAGSAASNHSRWPGRSSKTTQSISFTSTPPNPAVVGGTYTPTARGGASGNLVTFSVDPSAHGSCSISGAVVTFVAAGTCVIDANQPGNARYEAATQVKQFLAVVGTQSITFTSTPPSPALVGGTYTPTAAGGASGNPLTFSIDASANGGCSISGATVTLIAVGTCVIDANQPGNATYEAATQVQQSFAVSASGSTGGNCTTPIFSTSEATGTINTDPGSVENWWVDNDAWNGSHGPQTLNVCSASSWYAVSQQTNNQGQVETYPNTEYDVGGRNSPEYPSTKPISAYTSITSTFSEAFPTTGDSIDASYDLWLNNWSTEIMIWNEWTGTQNYWGTCAEPGPNQGDCGLTPTAVTLAGVPYHVLDLTGEIIFFRDTQVKSGSVDILAALNYLVSRGSGVATPVKASDAPTQLEYGTEICSTTGTQTFPLTGLTFNLS